MTAQELIQEAERYGVRLEPVEGDGLRVAGPGKNAYLARYRQALLEKKPEVLALLKGGGLEAAPVPTPWLTTAEAMLHLLEADPPRLPREYELEWWYLVVDALGALSERGVDWELYDRVAEAVGKGKRDAMLSKAITGYLSASKEVARLIDEGRWEERDEAMAAKDDWAYKAILVELAAQNGPGVKEASMNPWLKRPFVDWFWERVKKREAV